MLTIRKLLADVRSDLSTSAQPGKPANPQVRHGSTAASVDHASKTERHSHRAPTDWRQPSFGPRFFAATCPANSVPVPEITAPTPSSASYSIIRQLKQLFRSREAGVEPDLWDHVEHLLSLIRRAYSDRRLSKADQAFLREWRVVALKALSKLKRNRARRKRGGRMQAQLKKKKLVYPHVPTSGSRKRRPVRPRVKIVRKTIPYVGYPRVGRRAKHPLHGEKVLRKGSEEGPRDDREWVAKKPNVQVEGVNEVIEDPMGASKKEQREAGPKRWEERKRGCGGSGRKGELGATEGVSAMPPPLCFEPKPFKSHRRVSTWNPRSLPLSFMSPPTSPISFSTSSRTFGAHPTVDRIRRLSSDSTPLQEWLRQQVPRRSEPVGREGKVESSNDRSDATKRFPQATEASEERTPRSQHSLPLPEEIRSHTGCDESARLAESNRFWDSLYRQRYGNGQEGETGNDSERRESKGSQGSEPELPGMEVDQEEECFSKSSAMDVDEEPIQVPPAAETSAGPPFASSAPDGAEGPPLSTHIPNGPDVPTSGSSQVPEEPTLPSYVPEEPEEARFHSRSVEKTTDPTPRERFIANEKKWGCLEKKPHGTIRFQDVPWPLLVEVISLEDLTKEGILEFVAHGDRPGLRNKDLNSRARADLLRWHPDKFSQKVMKKVSENDKAMVQEGATKLVNLLTGLL